MSSITPSEKEREEIIAAKEKNAPTCKECGVEMKYVYEPVISGFSGFVCNNHECKMDQ